MLEIMELCDENVSALLNNRKLEVISFYDVKKGQFGVTENLKWIQSQAKEEGLVILPYEDELYPYAEAMSDFINEKEGLYIPEGKSAKQHLYNRGLLETFYEYRSKELAKRFHEWCKQRLGEKAEAKEEYHE